MVTFHTYRFFTSEQRMFFGCCPGEKSDDMVTLSPELVARETIKAEAMGE